MTKPDFPFNIDRRRLLVSAAALPGASIVPIGNHADTAVAVPIQSSAMAPEAEAANVCARHGHSPGGNRKAERPS